MNGAMYRVTAPRWTISDSYSAYDILQFRSEESGLVRNMYPSILIGEALSLGGRKSKPRSKPTRPLCSLCADHH